MVENLKGNLDVREDKSIKNTFLYIENIRINTESYESKILSEDNINNVIKYQLAYEGERQVLKYDVSNTISFEEYLKEKRLNKKDICEIMISIDDVLTSVENYLVSENSLSLDLRLMRVGSKRNKKVNYKYIAIPNLQSNFSYELSKFLIRMLRSVDVEDKDALSLGYSLFVRSSRENYTINDLMEIVDSVVDNEKGIFDSVSMDDLIKYDEEMAREISVEAVEGNKVDIEEVDYDSCMDDQIYSSNKNESLIIDDETKKALGESILNNFDNDDKKILKFAKGKKKKVLSGHIKLNIAIYLIIPLLAIVLPFTYYLMYGAENFVRRLPIIFAFVTIIGIAFVIKTIMNRVNEYGKSA